MRRRLLRSIRTLPPIGKLDNVDGLSLAAAEQSEHRIELAAKLSNFFTQPGVLGDALGDLTLERSEGFPTFLTLTLTFECQCLADRLVKHFITPITEQRDRFLRGRLCHLRGF